MGAKKNNKNNKGDSNTTVDVVLLKVDMHCDGCASKIIRHLRSLQGVETVKAESETGKLTVTGKVDPTEVRDKLAEKIKKKVELISPQPEKEKENKDTETNIKFEKKEINDKKPKDKEVVVTTAVLKVALHCQGCIDKIGKTVLKTKGVKEMAIDKEKETVTVKGTMDTKALVENLMEKLKRKVEIIPPKKDKEGAGGEKEGEGKKKNKEGGDHNNEGGEGKMEQNRMEYLVQPPFGYGYGYGNIGGYNYGPVYEEQVHFHLHAQPPPQMFSDENPNACSIM